MPITDLLLSITNFCLGRCKYCELKKLDRYDYDKEINVAQIERLLCDPALDHLEGIHITGGEPVIHPKTYGVFNLIKKYHPDIRVNMPISGYFPQMSYHHIRKLHALVPQLRVDVSMDGPPAIDALTRTEEHYPLALNTVGLLKNIKGLNIQIGFTLNDNNYGYITWLTDICRKLDVGYYITYPHTSYRFGHSENKHQIKSKAFLDTVEEQLKPYLQKRELNRIIWMMQKATWSGTSCTFDCAMGLKSLDVSPTGDVYPCMGYNPEQVMGNIREATLTEILSSEKAKDVLDGIARRVCQNPCIMTCAPYKANICIGGVKPEKEVLP